MTYAAVFPEPVFARATMSLPLSANGIAADCTKVGVSKFVEIAFNKRGSSRNEANDSDSSSTTFNSSICVALFFVVFLFLFRFSFEDSSIIISVDKVA
jgi:hypothetical protein